MEEVRKHDVDSEQKSQKEKRKFKLPHIYVILFVFSAIAAITTYIIPAGEFERIPGPEGRTTIDPESFTHIKQTPVGIVDFLTVIPRGLIDAGEVVFFTFIIGGMFMVLRKTGIIEVAVDKLARRFAHRSIMLIPVLTTVFAIIATLIGTAELSLVYIPVIMPLVIALGYDSITAAAIALCGTVVGFTAGVLNPINTGLGQKLAGVPVFSGMGLRFIVFVITITAAIFFIIRYAKKVKRDPFNSYVYEEDKEKRKLYQSVGKSKALHMSSRQKWAALVALLFFGILVYGVTSKGWFMVEMAGLFIIMGIVVGLIAGLKVGDICEGFNEGFRDVLMGAFIVGLARAVAVVLEDGQIMDTIVHALGTVVGDLPPALAAVGMYFVQMMINFVISSGSGHALVTMPIMAPLADMVGVTRQTAVLAYQLGDGFTHIFYPTSGYFMAALAIAGVAWQKWLRFILPLFLTWVGISVVTMVVAQVIGWS
ncbi:YfcC family protein [Aciduricibacillus chroicocephali]|uniref:YfcC family protein n=1 Tax=Aciduricibacillus chroicocephali TaxID=3054939 RepID=A0ABY9KWJ8_9BACI|nr:YfcC family protein [Bacillaceae bacterium 44XB]